MNPAKTIFGNVMTKFIHRHTINMGLIVGFDNGTAFNCINIVSTINPNPAAKKYSLSLNNLFWI